MNIKDALAAQHLQLERVTQKYIKKGGAPYHLLQEHNCRLIINIKLTNQKKQTMPRFVAWDGKTVHDHPYVIRVNKTTDRTDPTKSKMVFQQLYKKEGFHSFQVTNVFMLVNRENREMKSL